jgi:2-oxoacid:acceptor oxidoreductase delta subunit (pyruvate/2-ketoisovalerate family)
VKKALGAVTKKYGLGTRCEAGQYTAALWREQRPVWELERCFTCGICCLSCPDAAILLRDDGYYEMHAERCKGCGICAGECPNEAITMKAETL